MFLTVLLSYLLGSIPNGLLVGRLRGIDIRQHGSGNIGATNVFRVLGKGLGILVFLLDAGKGLLAVRLAMGLAQHGSPELSGVIAAISCIIGHNFPVWLKFKGGKGIATSAGVLIGLLPWATLIVFAVWGVVFSLSRYVSLASVVAAAALPVVVWMLAGAGALFYFALAAGVLAILRHKSNIQRLLNGTENRFKR